MVFAEIAPFTKRQYGLVTHAQALTVIKRDRIKHEVEMGHLESMRRFVLRVAGTPESWHQYVLAACLAHPGACASFSTAAALWALPGFDPEGIEITVPGFNRARLDHVIVHESTTWGDIHVATRARIPVTSVARTLCDLSCALGPGQLGRIVDDALRRKLVTMRQFARVAAELDGQGRRRCTTTRLVLNERAPGCQPGDSDPEKRIADLLMRAGLPRPKLGHQLRITGKTIRLDIAYVDARFGFEYDSWGFHGSRSAFDSDRERDIELELIDWRVPRLTAKTSDTKIVALATRALERAGTIPTSQKNRRSGDV
jgi:hypothetical protein